MKVCRGKFCHVFMALYGFPLSVKSDLFFLCRRSISAPEFEELEDDTLVVPQDYNMAMREVNSAILYTITASKN